MEIIKNKKKERDSNFEILRIICIFMIILSHFCDHGGILDNISSNNVTINKIIAEILIFQKWTIHVFILITGYFMIKSKVNYKKLINLIIEMFFYSIIIAIVFYGFNIIEFDKKKMIKAMFPIFWGNWFVKFYIILYLLIPYINLFINKIDKKTNLKIILLLTLIYTIIPTITNNAWQLTYHNVFILDYLIGAYIRLYSIKKLENNKFNKTMIIILSILSIIFTFGCMVTAKKLNIDILLLLPKILINPNNSIVQLLIGIFMFSIFKNIKLQSKSINYISSSVVGIYLIHDNDLVRDWLWKTFWPNSTFINANICLFLLHIFLKVVLVFVVCFTIDKIRIILFKNLESKISDSIYNALVKIKNKIKNIYNIGM